MTGGLPECDTGRMWEERAYRARRDITALAASGLSVSTLHAEAIRIIGRDISSELTCWATIDPGSLVISTMTNGETRIPSQFEPLLADAEYSPREPHTFASMAKRKEALTRMSDLAITEQDSSARYRNVWRPLGVNQEVRVLFDCGGACWGGAGIVRAGMDFTSRELEYLAAIAPAVAGATRMAVRSELSGGESRVAPAIVLLDSRGSLRSATPEAKLWEEQVDEGDPGRFLLMMRIMARGARGASAGGFRATVRDGRGGWAVMQASVLIGDDSDDVAVSIAPARGERLTSMLLAAYGLSPRECEVCLEVMSGHPTATIAQRLFVSPNTVQDHLKSIFLKVGVRSRGELVARLSPTQGSAPAEFLQTKRETG